MSNSYYLVKPLLSPSSYIDETPIGYFIRLSSLNKYGSYRWLVKSNKPVPFYSSHHRLFNLLSRHEWTGYKNENNIAKKLLSVSTKYFIRETLRFCPLCLEETGYYKINWQLGISAVCNIHKVWLLDRCPDCRNLIGINILKPTECLCGADLRFSQTHPISIDVDTMQNFLWEFNEKNSTEALILNNECNLTFKEKLDIITFFARWRLNGAEYKPVTEIDAAKVNLSDAAEALFSGKAGFNNFLKRLQLLGRGSNNHGKEVLTKFHLLFYKNFQQPCFDQFKEAIEFYINNNWYKPLTRRNRNFDRKTIEVHPWIPFQVACREFDINKSILKRVIKANLIRSQIVEKENRVFVNIYRPDLEARIDRINDNVTAKEAASILGLTKAQFSLLREQNKFTVMIAPSKETGMNWQFSRDEIYLWRNSFIKNVKIVDGEVWSFSQLLQYFGGQLADPLITILRAIEKKELYVYTLDCNKVGLASMMFTKTEFIAWLEVYKARSAFFSVTVAAKIMRLNQEFTYQLVNEGFLKSDIVGASNLREMKEEYIAEFSSDYVLLSKLAKKVSLNSRTLISYLASKEIYPIDHNRSFKFRQKVYRKNDLINVQILKSFI